MAELVLALLDRVSVEVTEQVAVERKISAPVLGPVAELAKEISAAAIVLAVDQVRAAPVADLARCRLSGRPGLPAAMVSEIEVSHPAQDSVRVATLLAAAGLTEAPLDRQVTVEVPAWEAVDSAAVAAHVLAEARVVAVEGVEGRQTMH